MFKSFNIFMLFLLFIQIEIEWAPLLKTGYPSGTSAS